MRPYLSVNGGAAALDFYKSVFGATEGMRMGAPDGRIGHAELQFGDSKVMLADEFPEMNMKAASDWGYAGHPDVYVADVDAVFESAVAAGATSLRAVETQFYGDRSGQFEDPFGHRWSVATHVEDVAPDEMERRAANAMSGQNA